MNESDPPIQQILDAYKAAVFAKDVDALVALYDEDVRVFDLWGAWSYDGVDAWRRMIAGWFGTLGAERVVVEWHDVQTIVGRGVAMAHAFVSYQGLSAEGQTLHTMHNRLSWALAQKDGSWKIVHEHTSAPVDSESSKVILRR